MAEVVLKPDEIALNGVHYRIEGPVETELASVYPEKTVIGDYTLQSRPRVSVKTWSDWRGGFGLERDRGDAPTNQYWFSQLRTNYHRHLTLPPIDVITSSSTEAAQPSAMGEFGSVIYVAFGTKMRSYTSAGDTWSALLDTLPGAATSAITAVLGGTKYLIFGQAAGFTYTSDGAAYVDVVKNSDFLAVWDDKLWGIDDTGQLWYASNPTVTPVDDAKVPLGEGSVTSLFVGPDAAGDMILYAGTTEGLFAHDFANAKFWQPIRWPHVPNSGKGCFWNGSIYVGYGALGVFRYMPSTGDVVAMGPDQGDGPLGSVTDFSGSIGALLPGFRELYLLFASEMGVLPLSWDGVGWRYVMNLAYCRSPGLVSNAYSAYRLWGTRGGEVDKIFYVPIVADRSDNPVQNTSVTYDAVGGELQTAWFSPGEPDETTVAVDGTAITAGVGSTTPTAAETVTIGYRLNYSTGSFTTLGSAITCEALKTTAVSFPDNTTPTGTEFKAIQFQFILARGTTGSNPEKKSPDLISFTLASRKKLAEKWRFGVTINGFEPISANTPETVMAAVRAAIGSTTKVEFTFRDSDKPTGQVFYVDVVGVKILEQTGLDERSKVKLVLEEI